MYIFIYLVLKRPENRKIKSNSCPVPANIIFVKREKN